jgi:outer membrane protein insertion porin family
MRSSVIIFCFFSAALLNAQMAPKAPQAAYEGQNVSAISLIANPHRNLEPLYPVVSQKAGTPFSKEQIQQSAESLQKAGGFPEVRVSVDPDVTGLRVSFLLEPAYYLGVIDFPGAVKRFSYTTLLQVVNFQDEDPYDPARLPVAQDALLNFFHQNGYFQAKVHAEPKIDDEHQLVSVVFAVETEKQARISSVRLDGPGQPENSRLMHAVRSESGQALQSRASESGIDPIEKSSRRTAQAGQQRKGKPSRVRSG